MTADQHRLKPIGFWSYARQDDAASDGKLSQLRGQLARELQQVYGRDPITLWQDVAAIPPGTEWEKAIDDAIAQSTYLIPIITPAFVESQFCCREVEKFLAREAEINAAHPELKGQRRIFPIFYIDVEENDPFDPDTVARLMKLQFVDLRQLRKDDDPQQIRKAILRLAGEIARLLKIKVTRLPTPEELETRRHVAAERARREQERQRLEQERIEREQIEARQKAEAEQQFEWERLAEQRRKRETQDAARRAAREARYRSVGGKVGKFATTLNAFFRKNRHTTLGLGIAVGVIPLALMPAILTTSERTPALSVIGMWTVDGITCNKASHENGRQQIEWTEADGWRINGAPVDGKLTANADGWFEIDSLFWRLDGQQLHLSVQGGDDGRPIVLNRCGR